MIRLALRVRRADAELVLAELLELAPGGVEEVDIDSGTVEYAVYGPPGELPTLPDLKVAAGGAFVQCTTTEIADDWADRWREFHRPLVIGDQLCVRPPWEAPARAEIDVVIDPGRAFGTGAHATTSLCLRALIAWAARAPAGTDSGAALRGRTNRGASAAALRGSHHTGSPAVVDLGCGSGVLAITAAKLGLEPVLALDFDPLAVDATRENAVVNGVSDEVRVARLDLRREPVPAAPLVLANLLAPLLEQWAAQIAAGRSPRPDVVVASGLLTGEVDRVCGAFAAAGLIETGRASEGDWASLTVQSGPPG